MVAGAAGAYVGMGFAHQIAGIGLWILVPWIALLFILKAVQRIPVVSYIILFAFTFVGGLVISPMIAAYISAGAGNLVISAFTLTAIAFGGLSIFAMVTKKDFTILGKFLFIALLVLIGASLQNYFFMQSTMASLLISSGCVLVFSGFILYDTQRIIKGACETPIEGAIALYLDALNLFIHLLNILGITRD